MDLFIKMFFLNLCSAPGAKNPKFLIFDHFMTNAACVACSLAAIASLPLTFYLFYYFRWKNPGPLVASCLGELVWLLSLFV